MHKYSEIRESKQKFFSAVDKHWDHLINVALAAKDVLKDHHSNSDWDPRELMDALKELEREE